MRMRIKFCEFYFHYQNFLKFFLFLSLLFFWLDHSSAKGCTPLTSKIIYTVRSGDSLGAILDRHKFGPLWGPNQYVERVARKNELNPDDTLKVRQKIFLPFRCEEQVAAYELKDAGPYREIITRKQISQSTVQNVEPQEVKTAIVTKPVRTSPITSSAPSASDALPARNVATETVATPAENSTVEDNSASVLRLDFLAEYSAYVGTDRTNNTQGRLLSKLSPGIRLSWQQIWDPNFETQLFLDVKRISIENERSGIELQNSELTNTAFGVGATWHPSTRWHIGGSVTQGPTIFYRGALVGSGLEMNAVPIIKIRPEIQYTAIQRKKLSLGLVAGMSYYGGGEFDNYSIESGNGYDFGVQVQHRFTPHSDLRCSAGYGERNQNTSFISLIEKYTSMSCGLGWRFE